MVRSLDVFDELDIFDQALDTAIAAGKISYEDTLSFRLALARHITDAKMHNQDEVLWQTIANDLGARSH
jgi:hypothetical protein